MFAIGKYLQQGASTVPLHQMLFCRRKAEDMAMCRAICIPQCPFALRSLNSEWSVLLIEMMQMSLAGSKAKALDQEETIGYKKAIDQMYDLHTLRGTKICHYC